MIKYKVANKYAKALYELTKESKLEEKVLNDLSVVNEIFQESKDFRIVMVGAIVSSEEKKKFIEVIAKKYNFDKVTENFLKILVDKRKFKFVTHIFEKYKKIFKDNSGIISANIISAIKLDKSLLNELKDKLAKSLNKQLEVKEIIDEDILGGIIIKTEGITYDGSLKLQLNKIKENILKG